MTVRDLWQEMVRLVMVEKIDLDSAVKLETYGQCDSAILNSIEFEDGVLNLTEFF